MKFDEKIESFVFNEENDDEEEDIDEDEDDDEDQANLPFNTKYSAITSSNLMPTIDADTRIKLEALLANAGSRIRSYFRFYFLAAAKSAILGINFF